MIRFRPILNHRLIRQQIAPRRAPIAKRGCQIKPYTEHNRHCDTHDVHEFLARREQFDGNAPRHGCGCRHTVARRRPARRLIAIVTKKMALTASTTAPPVGTSSFVEITRPPTPARNATATLHSR